MAAGAPVADPAGAEWTIYGGNLYNQRFSGLDQINTTNVAQLKGAWTYQTGAQSAGTSFESSPIVVGGVMYLTGPQSQVYALDARTGQELWKYIPTIDQLEALPLCCGQVNRGVAVGAGKVFVGQVDAKLTALDQATGQVAWSVQVGDPRAGYSETMAPIFHDGLVYIGISGAEYEIRGYVTAYNADTGDQVWRFYTIPGPGEFGHETWPQDNDWWMYGGGSVWQVPAIDPELGMMYIVVGNPSPDLDGTNRAGDNLFTESVVALDLKTGEYKWHFQEVHHDIWDYDTVSPNILFDVEMNGQTVKGLGQAGKTGWVYLLNRETGQPLIGVEEKPVPQMAEQHTAATQPFPIGDAFVPLECPEQVANYPMGGIFTPFGADPVLICPGANGGSEWSPASYSPQTELMYVCGIHQPQIWTFKPDQLEPGTLRLGSAFITPPGGKTSGTFTAIDVKTNKIAWQAEWANMCIGGSLATAGGLVFAGEADGNFDAYDAQTGDLLWQFQTGAGVNAPAVTYELDGTQYVAVASGGNFQLNFPRGDTLWVFALNGTMGPVEAPPPPSAEVSADAVSVNQVEIIDFGFKPGVIIIPPGTEVTWTNTGQQPHTATSVSSEVNAVKFDSGILNNGQSYSFTFEQPATYDYFCTVHPFMRGKVIVDPNAPAPAATPTEGAPQEIPEGAHRHPSDTSTHVRFTSEPTRAGAEPPREPTPSTRSDRREEDRMGARHLSAGAIVVLAALLVAAGSPTFGAVSRDRPADQEATNAIGDDAIAADEAELRATIEAVLDPDTRRGVGRLPSVRLDPTGDLTVVVALRDFGTLEAIRDGAEEDALAILRAIHESPVAGRVRTTTLIGTFAVTGTRGTRELRVMRVVLSAERAIGIEWGAVAPADLATVTDLWKLYPPFGTLDRLQPLTEPDPIFSSPVDIGDRRLFLRCIGSGGPTVILEGGYGDDGTIWGPVQLPVARFARVCSYDRAGLMRSDPPGHYPRTADEVVADLHALLTAAEVKPPYVLVGHSFGALYVRLYAATYPDEVAGLVLVDPWHEDFYFHHCAIAMSCRQLAMAARYLAHFGNDPTTVLPVVTPERARRINALMLTCGHYDGSGEFAYRVGLPGKSGVGGGIMAIVPGKASIAVWSPGLDASGNSQLGQLALERLSKRMEWSIFGA